MHTLDQRDVERDAADEAIAPEAPDGTSRRALLTARPRCRRRRTDRLCRSSASGDHRTGDRGDAHRREADQAHLRRRLARRPIPASPPAPCLRSAALRCRTAGWSMLTAPRSVASMHRRCRRVATASTSTSSCSTMARSPLSAGDVRRRHLRRDRRHRHLRRHCRHLRTSSNAGSVRWYRSVHARHQDPGDLRWLLTCS